MSMRNSILASTAAVSLIVVVSAAGAFAQQSSAQQKCLNGINKDGAGVAKTQSKENVGCLKDKGNGKLIGSAQTCLSADAKGKVQKAKDKTTAHETKNCGTPPGFGYTGATTANDGAVQGELDLEQDIFGTDLDAATISCSANKPACQCQQKVLKDVEKLADTKLAEFVKCKKAALKAGATSIASLRDCVSDAGTPGSIAADTKGKIQKGVAKVGGTIAKSCVGVAVGTAFPGDCNAAASGQLADCLDQKVECRICQILNDMDGLFVNCDLFDDGTANGSCVSGTGPTPTPTPTLTPTPTPTATAAAGLVFKGSLPATVGRFNYNLTLGLPGANAACNTNFPGTHACTYPELQSAQTAGDLVGAHDVNGMLITSFWAIDSSQPALQQCQDDALGGSNLNWEYATAHTGSRGQRVALTNATGVLGSLQTSVQCNLSGSSWVGCCQ